MRTSTPSWSLPIPGTTSPAISHFGRGILTFHVALLFQTSPDVDLMVQGPINRPKDAIAPLTGVVETDWAPYTFTMNGQFTRAQAPIRFAAGEPYCHVFPIRRGALETIEPKLAPLSTNPDLKRQYETWMASRNRFNADLKLAGSEAQAEKWQKLYHRGLLPDDEVAQTDSHRTRVRLKPFRNRRLVGAALDFSPRDGGKPASGGVPDDQAERDACRKFDIVAPFEAGLRQDRIAGAQSFRDRHAGDRDEPDRGRDRDAAAAARARMPSEQEAETERNREGDGAQIFRVEVERVDDDMMRGQQDHHRHHQIARQVGCPRAARDRAMRCRAAVQMSGG